MNTICLTIQNFFHFPFRKIITKNKCKRSFFTRRANDLKNNASSSSALNALFLINDYVMYQ